MPIYEYACSACGHELEALQKLSDPKLVTCPVCHRDTLAKKVSAAGFQLKGSGWYVTDFRNGSKPAKAGDAASKGDTAAKDKSDAAASSESSPDKPAGAKDTPAKESPGKDAPAAPAATKAESAPASKPTASPSTGSST
ncbi:MAG TPA: zinc ribbon domain-containing protein [Casimicrobiaceae bacterium]|jgi:putative FmdB family regulatory protein|nr:zinc ribbon domain-containing protein [Casimicrobiaceae bacterium]